MTEKKNITLEASQNSGFLRINWFICLKQSNPQSLIRRAKLESLAVFFLTGSPACCDADSLVTETQHTGTPLGAMLRQFTD